jgi:hypothetical protein
LGNSCCDIHFRFLFLVEVLHSDYRNISINFLLLLSTKEVVVEMVEVVEIYSYYLCVRKLSPESGTVMPATFAANGCVELSPKLPD